MKKNVDPVFVTEPSLAPLKEYVKLLEGVWDRKILTHNGPLVQKLEHHIANKLNLKSFLAVSNGTIAIQMAIKALNIQGEIILPAFTWIATISAIKWEGCVPVFCDIDPLTLNIDYKKIEKCITKKTVAIMPVHVFGSPCEVDKIQEIAHKHSLKVIYDAAHAVGSTFDGRSVLEYGDISATSLHATKLLNTGEGGGCVTRHQELNLSLKRIRFFGHNDDKDIVQDGFNGKMTEVHAALGLANLKYFDKVLKDRKDKYNFYLNELTGAVSINFQKINEDQTNYSYFPTIFKNEKQLLKVLYELSESNIYARRYFYPSANTFNKVVKYFPCKISESISKRIICLPLFKDLRYEKMCEIINIIKNTV
jgi:dTDP-4-amino-4,6-dideoxygalactose transaminase